jgi:hypothetical protein
MAILVYNPCNQKYYKQDSYCIDPYHLPSSVYSNIKYDGGLFVSLHRDDIAPNSEPFPPGTRVAKVDPTTGHTQLGTIMDIPFDPNSSPHYLVQFDDSTSSSILPAKCLTLSPNHQSTCPTIPISFRHSLKLVLKSHLKKRTISQGLPHTNTRWLLLVQLQIPHQQETRRLGSSSP